MSVLIKGMKMPENCYHCMFSAYYTNNECEGFCIFKGDDGNLMSKEKALQGRQDYCPLVEVVHCKDCKHKRYDAMGFCPDGERREDGEIH